MHHGCNGKYIDRNHAGCLIIWDKMFGTFEPDGDRPIYGTVKQVATWNALAATIAPFADIARTAIRAPHIVDKLRVWFMPPEWCPRGMSFDLKEVVARPKHETHVPRGLAIYVTTMFTLTLALVVAFLFVGTSALTTPGLWAATIWITVSLASLGALLDGNAWAKPLEVARLVALVPLAMGAFL